MDFSKLKNKPFMLIKMIYQPAPDQKTSKKNWGKTAKWQIKEQVFFVDRLNSNHIVENTIIIDLLSAVVLKNRLENLSNGEVYAHFVNKYKKDVLKAIDVWRKKRGLDLLTRQPNVEAAVSHVMENFSVNEKGMIVLDKSAKTDSSKD